MDLKDIKKAAEVMKAYCEGKAVECKHNGEQEWQYDNNPNWDWSANEYRIANFSFVHDWLVTLFFYEGWSDNPRHFVEEIRYENMSIGQVFEAILHEGCLRGMYLQDCFIKEVLNAKAQLEG